MNIRGIELSHVEGDGYLAKSDGFTFRIQESGRYATQRWFWSISTTLGMRATGMADTAEACLEPMGEQMDEWRTNMRRFLEL